MGRLVCERSPNIRPKRGSGRSVFCDPHRDLPPVHPATGSRQLTQRWRNSPPAPAWNFEMPVAKEAKNGRSPAASQPHEKKPLGTHQSGDPGQDECVIGHDDRGRETVAAPGRSQRVARVARGGRVCRSRCRRGPGRIHGPIRTQVRRQNDIGVPSGGRRLAVAVGRGAAGRDDRVPD